MAGNYSVFWESCPDDSTELGQTTQILFKTDGINNSTRRKYRSGVGLQRNYALALYRNSAEIIFYVGEFRLLSVFSFREKSATWRIWQTGQVGRRKSILYERGL